MRHRPIRPLCLAAAATFFLAASLGAQGGGATPPGGGGSTTPTTPNIPTTPTTRIPTQTTPQQDRLPDLERPVIISGRVQLEDGTAPPEPAVIERVCGGTIHREGYTDARGRFTIQLGQNRMVIPDASVSGAGYGNEGSPTFRTGSSSGGTGLSGRDFSNCDVRAQLPGYVSDSVPLFGRRSMDNPEIGSIILHRFGNVIGTTVSATTLAAPKDARKAYEKGLGSMKKQKWADGRKEFEKAVASYPEFAEAWYELGVAQDRLNNGADARQALQKAIELDAKFVKPHVQLAELAARERSWKELSGITAHIFELDAYNYPAVYYFDAVAEYNLGNLAEAEQSARQALKLDKSRGVPAANHILGAILAVKGDLDGAAGALKAYLNLMPNAPDAPQARKRLAEIERVAAARQNVAQ